MSEATGRAGCDLTASGMTDWIRGYFAACNSGDVDRVAEHFEPDGVHYFPPGMYAGPFRGVCPAIAKAVNKIISGHHGAWIEIWYTGRIRMGTW